MFLAFARGDAAGAASFADVCLRLPFRDPEGLFFLCIVHARLNDHSCALSALRQTVDAGFACLPGLACDLALRPLSRLPEFNRLRADVEARHQRAVAAFNAAGGHEVLEISVEAEHPRL